MIRVLGRNTDACGSTRPVIICEGTVKHCKGKEMDKAAQKQFPKTYAQFLIRCNARMNNLGEMVPYTAEDGRLVLVAVTRLANSDHATYETIEKCLEWFKKNYKKLGITEAAFPALGCCNGDLLWCKIKPMLLNTLLPLPMDVDIYAPPRILRRAGRDFMMNTWHTGKGKYPHSQFFDHLSDERIEEILTNSVDFYQGTYDMVHDKEKGQEK